MATIHLDDYVSAGYYITKQITRTDWHSTELLSDRFLSVSHCIADIAPIVYWANSQKDFDTFGIELTPELQEWCSDQFDKTIGFPDVIYHLQTARDFIARFIPQKDDLFLLGAGLHKDFIEPFLLVEPTLRMGVQDEGQRGLAHIIGQRSPLPEGEILGYEVVCSDFGDINHSWLCNGLEKDGWERFQIRPNQHGFIETYAEAKTLTEFIMTDPAIYGEPGFYMPLLIIKYPLEQTL
ncbi:MAG: hypothetical protein BroJett018_06880 [Chloroflexota bacterium]|nr:hypothetical protein [Chloroflexota bacterium]NOG63082.1 hypothetical protein [Chloroflexota bacterium]GIK62894.1 MAG: hypothetical protein BroJett018_06880 [Chloroflexota bacterium]